MPDTALDARDRAAMIEAIRAALGAEPELRSRNPEA
jgi:hypothetical protein